MSARAVGCRALCFLLLGIAAECAERATDVFPASWHCRRVRRARHRRRRRHCGPSRRRGPHRRPQHRPDCRCARPHCCSARCARAAGTGHRSGPGPGPVTARIATQRAAPPRWAMPQSPTSPQAKAAMRAWMPALSRRPPRRPPPPTRRSPAAAPPPRVRWRRRSAPSRPRHPAAACRSVPAGRHDRPGRPAPRVPARPGLRSAAPGSAPAATRSAWATARRR